MSHGGNYSLSSFCSTSYVVVKEEGTMQKKQIETRALLSALLPPTGVSFYANSVKFCVVQVYHFWGSESSQKWSLWCFEASQTPWRHSVMTLVTFWKLHFFMIFEVFDIIFLPVLPIMTSKNVYGHFLETSFFHDF